jgi:hypothetical protein
MNTNSKNHPVYDYILESIYLDERELAKKPETNQEKLQAVVNIFKSEYDYMIKKYGMHNAFREWLAGLPSVLNIDFENYKILQLAEKWGSTPKNASEKQQDRILLNWFNFITMKFSVLCRRNKVVF